ncbi:MAG TPA: hypothetical protein VGG06_11075 [Thermoanaerobaculia bacterium]|jgi:hypothetical protein
MRLPNADQAWIPREKIVDYLLSMTHSVGSAKSKFFRGFGFGEHNTELLERGLLLIARSNEVRDMIESIFGSKYTVDGDLQTPSGVVVSVRTVWIIEAGEENPRFVTAYPA